jgi:hypothetical protein
LLVRRVVDLSFGLFLTVRGGPVVEAAVVIGLQKLTDGGLNLLETIMALGKNHNLLK